MSESKASQNVSIINLISNPESYKGKNVFVIGIGTITDRSSRVALDQFSHKYGVTMNSISLNVAQTILSDAKLLDNKPVMIEGKFIHIGKNHYAIEVKKIGLAIAQRYENAKR